jgi:hypothetical protein
VRVVERLPDGTVAVHLEGSCVPNSVSNACHFTSTLIFGRFTHSR